MNDITNEDAITSEGILLQLAEDTPSFVNKKSEKIVAVVITEQQQEHEQQNEIIPLKVSTMARNKIKLDKKKLTTSIISKFSNKKEEAYKPKIVNKPTESFFQNFSVSKILMDSQHQFYQDNFAENSNNSHFSQDSIDGINQRLCDAIVERNQIVKLCYYIENYISTGKKYLQNYGTRGAVSKKFGNIPKGLSPCSTTRPVEIAEDKFMINFLNKQFCRKITNTHPSRDDSASKQLDNTLDCIGISQQESFTDDGKLDYGKKGKLDNEKKNPFQKLKGHPNLQLKAHQAEMFSEPSQEIYRKPKMQSASIPKKSLSRSFQLSPLG